MYQRSHGRYQTRIGIDPVDGFDVICGHKEMAKVSWAKVSLGPKWETADLLVLHLYRSSIEGDGSSFVEFASPVKLLPLKRNRDI